MSAIYGCTAEIHLPPPNAEIHWVIENLGRRLGWASDAQLEQESASDGTVWLNVHCPEQNCGHAFIEDLDAAFAELARHAIEGFAVDYVYEADRGADFHGPTAEAKAIAKRNWNFARAAYYLEQEGIDLHRLLELPVAASAVVEDIKAASGPATVMRPTKPAWTGPNGPLATTHGWSGYRRSPSPTDKVILPTRRGMSSPWGVACSGFFHRRKQPCTCCISY